jgi:hypothetical protein
VVELVGTIDGMALDASVTGDLEGSASEIGMQVVDGDQGGACRSLAGLSKKIGDYRSKGKLTSPQAATLGAAVAGIQGVLGC